jgi:hypothetical protein
VHLISIEHLRLIISGISSLLPYPLVPNTKTISAMKAAREGKTKAFASVEALMADLKADD